MPVSDLLRQVNEDAPEGLLALRDALMVPVASMDPGAFDPAMLRGEVALPGDMVVMAEQVVQYSYALHFQAGGVVEVPYHTPATSPTTRVLAAVQRVGGRDIVMGTIRADWGEHLEVFDLFEVPPPARWPHEELGQPFGELHKMAWHPAVEALTTADDPDVRSAGRAYRVAAWDALRRTFERVLSEHGRTHVYYLTNERVRRFFTGAGYHATRLDTALPARSAWAQRLRQEWHRYFLPDEPVELQPHVFYHPTR